MNACGDMKKRPLNCKIFARSLSRHLSQIYTGYAMLARQGLLDVKQVCGPGTERMAKCGNDEMNGHGLYVQLEGGRLIYYDMKDSSRLDDSALNSADAYYKRSYKIEAIPDSHSNKVFPFGLYYEVYCDGFDKNELIRVFKLAKSKESFITRIAQIVTKSANMPFHFVPYVSMMHSKPLHGQEPGVLFMVRAWDPDCDPMRPTTKEEKEDRLRINNMRADCIRLLKKEFGPRFYGGFIRTEFAAKHYPELLLESGTVSSKGNYMSLVRRNPICIATTGLYGSIGAKMGEYVAFSRAIISEKLNYAVPGDFSPDKNYLEFETAEQCRGLVGSLFEDARMRQAMMDDNWRYYETHLRPDKLVLKTLS